jgi:hypothetical protein
LSEESFRWKACGGVFLNPIDKGIPGQALALGSLTGMIDQIEQHVDGLAP